MPTLIRSYQLSELSHKESKDRVFLNTKRNTQLDLKVKERVTIITFPYGNKFDIIDGAIIIHDKN